MAPALSKLRMEGETSITLVGYLSRLEPLARAGLADRVLSVDDFLRLSISLPAQARIDSFFTSLPGPLLAHPGLRIRAPFPPEDRSLHVSEYLASCLNVGLGPERFSPLRSLLVDQPMERTPILWVHPGSGGKQKRWPLEYFVATARKLGRMLGGDRIPGMDVAVDSRLRGNDDSKRILLVSSFPPSSSSFPRKRESTVALTPQVVFLLGEAEEDLEADVREAGFEIQHPTTLMELCCHFAPGDYYLGNDSGPTHLAALMGLQTLAVFGPTDPTVWGPWGERARWVKEAGGENWADPDKVLEKIPQWWFDPIT